MKTTPVKESKENAIEEKEKDSTEEGEASKMEITQSPEPRPLHKTYSLFMRNIPPNISRADIAAVSIVTG